MNCFDEKNIKQATIQDLCKAVRWGRTDIQTMCYDFGKDSVLIGFLNRSLWVNVAGDSVTAMLGDVMDAVRKH